MKDAMKPCQHSLSDDAVYKEVVVIGNGPSGMVTSFMLAGNVPYLKEPPPELPIDEMLRARLSNVKPGVSLYEMDLMELAEGLEGRSQNPIPLLMDILLRPCADLGIQADPLIEWKFDIDAQVDHVVLGRGPVGGAWQSFPRSVRTLSPAPWLALPPEPMPGKGRLGARAVANYCVKYVAATNIQRYFRCGVVVTSVTLLPRASGPPCNAHCPNDAIYCVTGYDRSTSLPFRYSCRRVVLACGGGDCPNILQPEVARHALHSLASIQRAVHVLGTRVSTASPPSVLVVGSGVSAADAVRLSLRAGLSVRHAHKAAADALAKLEPQLYPDYYQVYKMMCDGPTGNHPNYTPYPEHIVVEVTPDVAYDFENPMLRLKRVKLFDTQNKQTVEITVNLIAVLIGSKPDLFFLQTNFNLNCVDVNIEPCLKCDETKLQLQLQHGAKRKLLSDEKENMCSLKTHWHYLKTVLGQSIKSCKSRFNTEINGNVETEKCSVPDCVKRESDCVKRESEVKIDAEKDCRCRCEVIPYSDPVENKIKCICETNPYSSGLGFGLDPTKPVDGRANPIAIDKSTHEVLNAPKGMYALGPLTADNFIRFIPGGALAIAAHIYKEQKV